LKPISRSDNNMSFIGNKNQFMILKSDFELK